jgi:hypothetical protein
MPNGDRVRAFMGGGGRNYNTPIFNISNGHGHQSSLSHPPLCLNRGDGTTDQKVRVTTRKKSTPHMHISFKYSKSWPWPAGMAQTGRRGRKVTNRLGVCVGAR